MSIEDLDQGAEGSSAFERRARELLLDSVEHLPAAVRSQLTQARYAALATRPLWQRSRSLRWAPAGAAAVVALLLLVAPHHEAGTASPFASASPEDLALLADSDALQIGSEQDMDADFYEWAAGEADLAPSSSVGT
jgi:hypothetical protein